MPAAGDGHAHDSAAHEGAAEPSATPAFDYFAHHFDRCAGLRLCAKNWCATRAYKSCRTQSYIWAWNVLDGNTCFHACRQLTEAEVAQLRSRAPDRAAAEAALPPGVWPDASCLVTGEPLPLVRAHSRYLPLPLIISL